MPGHFSMLGWPWSLEPSWRSVCRSSSGKKPSLPSAAYWMGQTWPFESTKRSRSGHLGSFGSTCISEKYSAATMSAAESEPPGCPDCASYIIVTAVLRSSFARSLSSFIFSSGTEISPFCACRSTGDRLFNNCQTSNAQCWMLWLNFKHPPGKKSSGCYVGQIDLCNVHQL